MTENRKRVTVLVSGRNAQSVNVSVSAQQGERDVTVKALPVRFESPPVYDGDYDISPDFSGQVLETEGKKMARDVVIDPIYVSNTTNLAGGMTVYIGGEFHV